MLPLIRDSQRDFVPGRSRLGNFFEDPVKKIGRAVNVSRMVKADTKATFKRHWGQPHDQAEYDGI